MQCSCLHFLELLRFISAFVLSRRVCVCTRAKFCWYPTEYYVLSHRMGYHIELPKFCWFVRLGAVKKRSRKMQQLYRTISP